MQLNILEIDIGNTRIKWRMKGDTAGGAEGAAGTVAELQASDFASQAPDLVRIANVRADDSLANLQDWITDNWAVESHVAQVSSQCGGVRNGYSDVSRMGVDRWLAMVAAYEQLSSACLVVSAGTALTIDLLTAEGEHQGGYILPGLNMMASALQEGTGIRLQHEVADTSTRPGRITEAAVYNAALAACAALIEKCCAELGQSEGRVAVVLCGGDAGQIKDALNDSGFDVLISPNLVLDGLALACPQPKA